MTNKSPRGRHSFARKSTPTLKQRDRILVVCEDSVTTPNYLKSLCGSSGYKLNLSTEVHITGECGSSPSTVYAYALELLKADIEKNSEKDTFDRIYCVIDKDGHKDYDRTLADAKTNPAPNGKSLHIISSIPCFEYWVLLHYTYTTKHLKNCAAVIKELRNIPELKKYDKKSSDFSRNLHKIIGGRIDTAMSHAKRSLKEAADTGTDNPSTHIHILIEDFIDQSQRGLKS